MNMSGAEKRFSLEHIFGVYRKKGLNRRHSEVVACEFCEDEPNAINLKLASGEMRFFQISADGDRVLNDYPICMSFKATTPDPMPAETTLSFYADAEQEEKYAQLAKDGRLIVLPDIKERKTLYWLWENEIIPVLYMGVHGGCIADDGKFHVTCGMRTKKDHTFGNQTYKAGEVRYFYADDIGKTVFLTRAEAEAAQATPQYIPLCYPSEAVGMIADLGNGPATANGDRSSQYFAIAKGRWDPEETVSVALIENLNGLPEGKGYYTFHLVDDVSGEPCELYHTSDLNEESLVNLLKEILDNLQ